MDKEKYEVVPQSDRKGSTKRDDILNNNVAKESDKIYLKPKMSLLNGITVIVGSIIGSGIFITQKGVLTNTGSVNLSILIWIISGVFSLIGAYCYAELGCMITKTGADYAYIMQSFGPFIAFIRLWVECMIIRPASQAIVAYTFASYVLKPIYPTCPPPVEAIRFLSFICIGLLTFVNCYSVKLSTKVQDLFTYGKLIAIATIVITGFVQLGKGNVQHFTFENTETDFTKIALSFYSALFAYNGWNYLNFVIEELKDPHRNLPKAIFISCILVTVCYTFTIIAFHSALSPGEVLSAEAVAVTFAEKLYGSWAWIVPVFVALSTFGGVNGILFTSSRLFYAGAEYEQMPQVLSMISMNNLTPSPAVIAMCILSLFYLLIEDIGLLLNYVGFATWLAIGLAVCSLPYLRWKCPDLERPIKVHLIWPILYILCSIFVTVLPCFADPLGTGLGAIIILTGVPVYFLFIGWKSKPAFIKNAIDGFTITIQKLLLVVQADKVD